jgi:hypothetical protein
MLRLLRIAAIAACLIGSAASAQTPAAKNGITDLSYTAQADKTLYFIGKYQGKSVNLIRTGKVGSGSWTIYTGTITDRVRLTFDDKKGLREILAMDKGHRITLNRVAQERVEYRLYAPDRSFVIGSVLYRSKNRWLQGLMKTEAFEGYPALIDVTDVTKNINQQSASVSTKVSAWIKDQWESFDLIPAAHAEDMDDLIKGYFSDKAQDARNRWSAPGDVMWTGMLVGASAFTVKLIGAGETVAVGSMVAAATPFLVSVGAGVAIGLAADKVYNWAQTKNLGGTTSVSDFYNRLVAGTRFSNEPAPEPPEAMLADAPSRSEPQSKHSRTQKSGGSTSSLLDMADQLDKLDKQDFQIAVDMAALCTRKHDFGCADSELNKAAKLATGTSDKTALNAARQNVVNEKARVAEAARQRAEEERRIAAAEQQRAADEQARRARAEQESKGGFQWGKAGALLAGATIGGLGKMSGEMQGKVITSIIKDSAEGQEGINNFNSTLNTNLPSSNTSGGRTRTPTASAAAGGSPLSRGGEMWRDDMSTREVASGRVVQFNNHEAAIPGDVMASKMSSRSTAQSVWADQGGTVTDYSGCGGCGVGSTVTIIVKFSSVIDTHVYTRYK